MKNFSEICSRIANGDREAMAEFLMGHRSQILRRVRGKLRIARMETCDEEDVFSSLARRMDDRCRTGRVIAMEESDLVLYLIKSALNLTSDKIRAERSRRRLIARLRSAPGGAGEAVEALKDYDLIRLVLSKLNKQDRDILELRLRGVPQVAMAEQLDMTLERCRAKWQRVMLRARSLVQCL